MSIDIIDKINMLICNYRIDPTNAKFEDMYTTIDKYVYMVSKTVHNEICDTLFDIRDIRQDIYLAFLLDLKDSNKNLFFNSLESFNDYLKDLVKI